MVYEEPPEFVAAAARSSARRSVGAVSLAVLLAGIVVNIYLIVVARSVGPSEYALFGAFWSLALVLGFGAFLPIEQEVARALQGRVSRREMMLQAFRVSGLLALAEMLLLVLAAGWLRHALGAGMLGPVLALSLVSTVQFVVRGLLVGAGKVTAYALVLCLDATLRLLLAVVVTLVASPEAATFAWAMVAAIALAHAPVLGWRVLRTGGSGQARPAGAPAVSPEATAPAAVARPRLLGAIAPLLVGSLAAQALLNGIPILLPAVATTGQQATAGAFIASFTLARAPLFAAVPVQSTLLPGFVRLADGAHPNALRRLLVRFGLGIGVLGVAGLAVGYGLGPWLVAVIFGEQYRIGAGHMALLGLGVAAHLGLVILTQGLVASRMHGRVAASWLAGLAATSLVFLTVTDLLLRAELGFLVGSVVGLGLAFWQLFRGHTAGG